MPDVDDRRTDRRRPSAREAFELVGNETRAEVLRVLSEAREGGLPPALSFSELRDRLAVDTRSSQFNYHLDQLVGTFVEDRSEGSAQTVDAFVADDSGYALRPAGTFLTRLVTATNTPPDAPAERPPFEAATDCHHCSTTLQARYTGMTVRVDCPGCGQLYAHTITPPGLLADDPDDPTLLDRADAYLRRKYTTFARGTCPLCAAGAPPEVVAPGDINLPRADRVAALVRRACEHCGNLNYATVGTELLADPGVVAFRHERGRPVEDARLWQLPFTSADRGTEVTGTDPWRATVRIRGDGETLAVTVDGEMTVRERERR